MKRILVIRTGAIGDVIMASPMIRVMRDAWPEAYLAWLVEPSNKVLLAHHPMLDEIICWPKGEWHRLLKNGCFLSLASRIRQFSRDLRQRRFSLAIDAQGLARTRLFARLSGATERIGFDSKEPGRFLMNRIIARGGHIEYMSSEYYHLMKTMTLAPGTFAPEIFLTDGIRARARETLQVQKVTDQYLVICPFTTRPQKEWPDDRWAQLVTDLHAQHALPVVMLGGRQDIEHSRQIQNMTGDYLRNLTGQTTLIESAAVIEKSILVAGVDTGLTHMGTAFRRPTIALFGSTCPYLKTPSKQTTVIYNRLPCAPCRHKPTCDGKHTCMDSISVEQVCLTAKKVINQSG